MRCHIGRGGALALLNRLDFSLVMKNDLHGLGDHGVDDDDNGVGDGDS